MFRRLRQYHRSLSLLFAVPLLLTALTGVVLSVRQQFDWVQPAPPEEVLVLAPMVTFEAILSSLSERKTTGVTSWDDVASVIARPGKGYIQVRTKDDLEVQMNAVTGEVTKVSPRRTTWLIQLHEGTLWGGMVKWLIFFPASLVFVFLLLSGTTLGVRFYFHKFSVIKKRVKNTGKESRSCIQEKQTKPLASV